MLMPRTLSKVPGMASLRQLLQEMKPSISRSPILVISSEPGEVEKSSTSKAVLRSNAKSIGQACNLVRFTLAQQMGLRTIQSPIDSAVPTLDDVEERIAMASRVAASSIVAVGSGAAMDLAKAVAASSKSIEQVILVPASFGASFVSGSSHALIFDSAEEALVPVAPPPNDVDSRVVQLEQSLTLSEDSAGLNAVHTCAASALDLIIQDHNDANALELLRRISSCLENDDGEVPHEELSKMLYESGKLLSFGLGNQERSPTLALASSLVPTQFQAIPPLAFIRSLIPGMCQAALESPVPIVDQDDDIVSRVVHRLRRDSKDGKISKLSPSDDSQGQLPEDVIRSHLQSNQALWKCIDVPDATLLKILKES